MKEKTDFSVLIGGKAGFGIDKASSFIAAIFNRLGYRLYVYRDYPSLIRGGHTFSIIRASREKIASHNNRIGFLLALNQETLDIHKERLKEDAVIIYDSDVVKPGALPSGIQSTGIPLTKMIKAENLQEIMRNTGIIGAFCKVSGIDWNILETVFKNSFGEKAGPNLKIAKLAYDKAKESIKITPTGEKPLPVVSGNEAIGLGLINGGLKAYISYPMTPTSPILHFLAGVAEKFSLKVIHPESEIAVMLMATGFAYCGQKVAVGTSGGGFCLMTEGLSFSAMSELPVVIVLGQRPGPSTGLPTYSAQTELHFALNAGQGEFPRLIVAPGDAEEAYYWSNIALNLSWKYQLPAFVLSDKTLGEGIFSFDYGSIKDAGETSAELWDRNGTYKRYLDTETGVSPLAFPPDADAVIKANSYQHDEAGITIEDADTTVKMLNKILRKEKYLLSELDNYESVRVYGRQDSETALLCWGSNKGACVEAARKFSLKVVQPIALHPFPAGQFKKAMVGVKKLITVENNATAQLVRLINKYGFDADEKILRYDGRPFTPDELETEIGRVTGK